MKKTAKDIQMLGPQMTLEGTLVFEGTMIMNGHVHGTIESREGTIVVGESAVLHADILVKNATISGEIRGTVRATERIELHPPARVYGDLTAPVVIIDAGVTFDGKCSTAKNDVQEKQAVPAMADTPGEKKGFMKSFKNRKSAPESPEPTGAEAEPAT